MRLVRRKIVLGEEEAPGVAEAMGAGSLRKRVVSTLLATPLAFALEYQNYTLIVHRGKMLNVTRIKIVPRLFAGFARRPFHPVYSQISTAETAVAVPALLFHVFDSVESHRLDLPKSVS